MNDSNPRYWFPAKRYGWGWGLPCTWQGWLVLIVYLLAMVVVMPLIARHAGRNAAVAFAVGMTALLLYVAYKKGEPPGWHWGN
jgi:asparagine N-glycosylation enzyme membrane subunit Stt3